MQSKSEEMPRANKILKDDANRFLHWPLSFTIGSYFFLPIDCTRVVVRVLFMVPRILSYIDKRTEKMLLSILL